MPTRFAVGVFIWLGSNAVTAVSTAADVPAEKRRIVVMTDIGGDPDDEPARRSR